MKSDFELKSNTYYKESWCDGVSFIIYVDDNNVHIIKRGYNGVYTILHDSYIRKYSKSAYIDGFITLDAVKFIEISEADAMLELI